MSKSQLNLNKSSNQLGQWLINEKWEAITTENDVDNKLEMFSSSVFSMLNTIAPLKTIKISCDDPSWMNTRIKSKIRMRNREYSKNGKTKKWRALRKKCKNACDQAKRNFAEKFVPD